MKRICRYLPLVVVLLFSMPLIHAQSSFDIMVGFGAMMDSASSTQVDQNLLPCTVNDIAPPCVSTPSLNSFAMGVEGDLMLWHKFGVGADVSFQPAKQDFVNLNASAAFQGLNSLTIQSRMTLYDFNGIYQPVKTKKVAVKLIGGIGGANLRFYQAGGASSVLGSSYFSQYFQSANHFQVHGGLGVQIYVTDHIFVRPEISVHWVNNLTQYGRGTIIEPMVWLGYSLGGS